MSNCDDLYKRQAKAALEDRQKVIAELRAIEADNRLSNTEKRERIGKLDREVLQLEAEARVAIERAEREATVRSLAGGLDMLTPTSSLGRDEGSWRALMPSLSEYRALVAEGVPGDGGYTVPEQTATKYIDVLKAKSTFLRGLPVESIVPFSSATFSVPQLVSSDGMDYVEEGQTIPEGDMVWGEVKFEAKKIGRIQWASTEILEDSAIDLRNSIANNLLRDASLKFDADAFTGSGTNPIKGILSQGVSTTLGSGKITVTYDDLADAVARIEAMNGTPSVVWASVDMAAALRKEKAAGSGTYQAGSPTDSPASTAWGLPILSSAFLPVKTVCVADGSRIVVGIRRNATVRVSEDARFDKDQWGFKLTMRMAGVSLAEASSAQIVRAAAS
ncbi:phage major capsid protein [Streptomyces graminilatus]|uniref:phage major capsid protein n=1 Tax=Streptomyces graminilatus TaxID=1464070 RepID=UPI0006E3E210|nr:phage major capsid protein [Streptomyces graminilatus]